MKQTTKISVAILGVVTFYFGVYAVLRSHGGQPHDEALYQKLNREDWDGVVQWQPALASWGRVHYVDGKTTSETNLLGYAYAPLIRYDQRHRSKMALVISDKHGF